MKEKLEKTGNRNRFHGESHTVGFLDSFSADTSIVPQIISRLIEDLQSLDYPREEIDEIVISMDESITNAVQETIHKNRDIRENPERRDITVRYTVSEREFNATIIDHGRGLDLFNILKNVPSRASESYHDDVMTYATQSEKNKLLVRLNGREIPLKGIGSGLKIILKFMDSITIDFIDKKKVLSNSVTEDTDGTIFNIRRAKRYIETDGIS